VVAYLEYFDPRRLALQQELLHHQELCKLVAKHPPKEFELRLAEIAAYLGIVLDGDYSKEDLDRLCELLVARLYKKRSGILLS